MKPALAFVVLMGSGAVGPAIAQEAAAGLKVGVNLATIPELATAVGETGLETGLRRGLAVGGFVAVTAAGRLDIQPEFFYVQKGVRFEGSAGPFPGDATIELDYVEVPVLAVYRFAPDRSRTGYVFAGPAFAFNTSARVGGSGAAEETDVDDEVKNTEVSLIFGAGFSFRRLLAEARWTEGLTAVNDASAFLEEDVRNRAVTILVGVRF